MKVLTYLEKFLLGIMLGDSFLFHYRLKFQLQILVRQFLVLGCFGVVFFWGGGGVSPPPHPGSQGGIFLLPPALNSIYFPYMMTEEILSFPNPCS